MLPTRGASAALGDALEGGQGGRGAARATHVFVALYELEGRSLLRERVLNRTRLAPEDGWEWIRTRGTIERSPRGIGWFFFGTAKQPHLDEPRRGWFSPSTFRGLINNYGRDADDHLGYSVVQSGLGATHRVADEVARHIRELYLRKWRQSSPDFSGPPPRLDVDLFGFSRGAVTALAVANLLADPRPVPLAGSEVVAQVRVRYLYLLEPCATDSHLNRRARLCEDYALHEVIPLYEGVPVTGLLETAGGRDLVNGAAFPLVDLVGYLEQQKDDFLYVALRGGTRALPRLPASLSPRTTGFFLSADRTRQGHNGVSNWFEVGGARGLRLLEHARAVGVPFDEHAVFGQGGIDRCRRTQAWSSFHRAIRATVHELASSYETGRLPPRRRPGVVPLNRSRLVHQ